MKIAHLRVLGLVVVMVWGVGLAAGQDRDRRFDREHDDRDPYAEEERVAEEAGGANFFQRITGLMNGMRSLGPWEEQYGYIADATTNIYEQRGWDTDTDQFSLQMMQEVGAIPPWQAQDRLNAMVGMISERYSLDDEQAAHLQQLVIRESNDMFREHSGRILGYAMEAIQTRAMGEPFTKEQVARWTKMAQPVMQDGQRRLATASRELMEKLEPEQRVLLEQDLKITQARQQEMIAESQRWARGEWSPSDWGMQDDPIQSLAIETDEAAQVAANMGQPGQATNNVAARAPTPAQAARPTPRATPTRTNRQQPTARATARQARQAAAQDARANARNVQRAPGKPDEWAQYTENFIKQHQLNDDQSATAWRIYTAMKQRGDAVSGRFGPQIESLRERETDTNREQTQTLIRRYEQQESQQLERLFDALKQRLTRLLTAEQRAAAEK